MGRLRLALAAGIAALAGIAVVPGGATARQARARTAAQQSLDRVLAQQMRLAGRSSGAYVVDLSTRQPLFAWRSGIGRMPASNEKLFTTATALLRYGPAATLTTTVLANGSYDLSGGFYGTLYLKGGGDPTFGSAAFDRPRYGSFGATVEQLVSNLISATGMTSLHGAIVADETHFDSLRGGPSSRYQPSSDDEGQLSAVAFNRGWATPDGSAYQPRPALYAAQQFSQALSAAGVAVGRGVKVFTGGTPADATALATVQSPPMSTLIQLTNTPSDNFFAEMLLKDLGASYGGSGTTAAGAAVVRAQIASSFGIHPQVVDGSGLSRSDSATPFQVVTLLGQMASTSDFIDSLAVAGRTGTLKDEMRGTSAQGRCRGKTGTLVDASNLSGYCHARDGHTVAFSFLMNRIDPNYAHLIQNRMAEALAGYTG